MRLQLDLESDGTALPQRLGIGFVDFDNDTAVQMRRSAISLMIKLVLGPIIKGEFPFVITPGTSPFAR